MLEGSDSTQVKFCRVVCGVDQAAPRSKGARSCQTLKETANHSWWTQNFCLRQGSYISIISKDSSHTSGSVNEIKIKSNHFFSLLLGINSQSPLMTHWKHAPISLETLHESTNDFFLLKRQIYATIFHKYCLSCLYRIRWNRLLDAYELQFCAFDAHLPAEAWEGWSVYLRVRKKTQLSFIVVSPS